MYYTKLEISSCSNLRQTCELMNSPQMIDTLLAAGANIDQVFENGSALDISAWRGKTELVRHLLRRGARTGLVHSCTIFLCCLGDEIYIDDPYRNQNMNNKDHRVG